MGLGGIKVPGKTPPRGEFFEADWNIVEPGFFRTLKLPLTRGRDFSEAIRHVAAGGDRQRGIGASVWPGEDPLGKQMNINARVDVARCRSLAWHRTRD